MAEIFGEPGQLRCLQFGHSELRFLSRLISLETSFRIVLDLRQEPLEPIRLGFVRQHLGLQYFIEQAAIGAHPHALGLFGKWLCDPDTDAQTLLQFVRSPESPLPWLFVLACVGELTAMPA